MKRRETILDFLYLDEKDMIEAGVLNMSECIVEMEKVFRLLSKGDYIMGGKNHNSHGMLIDFPEKPQHSGMPNDGADRRFMAMPAYLCGEYGVRGCQWYRSYIDILDEYLLRLFITLTLNNVVYCAPL